MRDAHHPAARFAAALGDSPCARAILARDWAATPLGAIAGWPTHLKVAVVNMVRSPVPTVLLWGVDGLMVYNDGYAAIVGAGHPAALGRSVHEVWPEITAFNVEIIDSVMLGKALSFRDQAFELHRSGLPLQCWFDIDYSPLFDGDGAIAGVMAIVMETTRAKQAEADRARGQAAREQAALDLAESQRLLDRAQAVGGVGTFTVDVASGVLHVTPGFNRLFGFAPDADPDQAQVLARITHGGNLLGSLGDTADDAEWQITRANDGAVRWLARKAEHDLLGAGGTERIVGVLLDITDRRLAEMHQRTLLEHASRRDLDRIWTLSQELMLVCDFEGAIKAVNPAATSILGWQQAEMVGKTLADFLHPDDGAGTAAEVGKLAAGATTLAFENRYRSRDGSYRLLDWTAVPDGGLIHAVARDITRERTAEDALRQSQKLEAIGQLTGGVAHDFNNVLAVIRTSIDLLRLVHLTDDKRRRYQDAISDAVNRAGKLTGQLLAFARRQALQPQVFNVSRNLEQLTDMIASLNGSRIRIVLQRDGADYFVDADPSQFDTAIVNLAVNARDAMQGSGTLTITVGRVDRIPVIRAHPAIEGDFVAVTVADTGSGIADEHLAQVFEPFFTTKSVGHGTGLGLSQVFGFSKQSGGEVEVASVLGKGTAFTLYLPRTHRQADDSAVEPAPRIARGHGARILVVEDNADVAASVQAILEELGYTPVLAASGEAALDALAIDARGFALVFSDVVMGGMSGIALGQAIERDYPGLPVVLSSGYSQVLASDSGHGFTLLPKPYTLEQLARTVADALAVPAPGVDGMAAPAVANASATAAAAEQSTADIELFRQAELDAMQILDTAPESDFDDLTALAARFFDSPIALVSLIDGDRQWFKSRVGLDAAETPRGMAFCAHAIARQDEVMVVNDTRADPRFIDNPLVTGNPNIRFYAGAPLVTAGGHALGTLCVIDRAPRQFSPEQQRMLRALADKVMARIEQRRGELDKTRSGSQHARRPVSLK